MEPFDSFVAHGMMMVVVVGLTCMHSLQVVQLEQRENGTLLLQQ